MSAGMLYDVNEGGYTELFMPSMPGTILSATDTARVNQNQTPGIDYDKMADAFMRGAAQLPSPVIKAMEFYRDTFQKYQDSKNARVVI